MSGVEQHVLLQSIIFARFNWNATVEGTPHEICSFFVRLNRGMKQPCFRSFAVATGKRLQKRDRSLAFRCLSYMTSAQKVVGKIISQISGPHCLNFADRGEGVKKSKNYVDVIYGSPFMLLPIHWLSVHEWRTQRPGQKYLDNWYALPEIIQIIHDSALMIVAPLTDVHCTFRPSLSCLCWGSDRKEDRF